MDTALSIATPVAVVLVAGVLVAGLLNMARGNNASLSQKLMRWRVGLQFLAIIIIMATIYFVRR